MSNIKRKSKKGAALVMALAMLASVFAVMGLTAEEASAAAKAKKPAKMTIAKVESKNQCAKVSWKKAKKVKVGKKKRTVNYQLKVTTKDVWGKTSTKTYNLKNKTVSKTFYDHPGTKYTFRVRGVYVNRGKTVYGKWSAAKSKTIAKNGVKLEANRSGKGSVVAEANCAGACKKQKYDVFVFTFNGKTKRAKAGEAVIFDDESAGTLTVHGTYQAKKNGKTKTINTKTSSKYFKASGHSGGNISIGIGGTGDDMNSTSDIKIQKDTFVNDYQDPKNKNVFNVVFENAVRSKYNWKVTALDNSRLIKTLNLQGNNTPSIINADYHYMVNDEKHMEIRTNWQCINICLEAYDKSSGKKVFSKNIGWDYTYNSGYIAAPGNYHYGGPYYDRCVEIANKILDKSGFKFKYEDPEDKVYYLEKYTKYKFFRAYNYKDSMNAQKNLGFFENDMYLPNPNANSNSYLDITYYDYSKVLAYLVGVDGGDCDHFQMIETFIIKQYDPNATISAHQSGNSNTPDHVAIKASIKGSGAFASTTVDYVIDLSTTYYYSTGSTGRQAEAMYNSSEWRNYFKMALGDEAAAYYGL